MHKLLLQQSCLPGVKRSSMLWMSVARNAWHFASLYQIYSHAVCLLYKTASSHWQHAGATALKHIHPLFITGLAWTQTLQLAHTHNKQYRPQAVVACKHNAVMAVCLCTSGCGHSLTSQYSSSCTYAVTQNGPHSYPIWVVFSSQCDGRNLTPITPFCISNAMQ